MHFEQPWVLLLLLAVAPLVWRRLRGGADAGLRFSSYEPCDLRPTLRSRLAGAPFWLRIVAFCLLIAALAQPQTGGQRTRQVGRGLAIEMVIDRSRSMQEPIWYGGRQMARLDVAKQFVQEFVKGDGGKLKGRGSDMIGLIAFALRPETLCPLTFAHDAFGGLVSRVSYAAPEDNRTAIGDALALAAARLKSADAERVTGKVVILLTDGENNAGVRNVWEAGELAARWGVRVHAIGIVGSEPKSGGATYQYRVQTRYASERDLNQLAGMCGGVYRSAADGEALKAIYAEIDRLEKSEVAATRYSGGTDRYAPLAALAIALLAASLLSASTWLRRIP